MSASLVPSSSSSLPESGPARLARLALDAFRWLAGFFRAVANRREVKGLLELDDRELRDIGLMRCDVIGALNEPMARDPSRILVVRRVERRTRDRTLAVPRRPLTRQGEPAF